MREVNLAAIDLDLLPALDALLRRRNVTHAAKEVGLSQPAMTRALGRLRHLFEDPLLVRSAGQLVLTPKAERLAPQLSDALRDVRGLFREHEFDPAQEHRLIRLVMSDANSILLMPPLMARLAKEAPAAQIKLEGYGPGLVARMKKGEVDFVLALATSPLPPGVESFVLGQDRMVLVTRRGHPLSGKPLKVEDLERFPHVAISIFGDGQSEMNSMLAAQGLSRHVGLTMPYFMGALATVAATDHIATLSEALARRFAPEFGLVLSPSPLIMEPMTLTLVWDNVRSGDPALVWFRNLLREIAGRVYQSGGSLPADITS